MRQVLEHVLQAGYALRTGQEAVLFRALNASLVERGLRKSDWMALCILRLVEALIS